MEHSNYIWMAWIAAFGVLEGIALKSKLSGDTLSENVWKWFSIKDHATLWRLRRTGLLGFLAWLVAHFLTGGAF